MCNLDYDLLIEKMTYLHSAIENNFGIKPVTFRAGRWALNEMSLDAWPSWISGLILLCRYSWTGLPVMVQILVDHLKTIFLMQMMSRFMITVADCWKCRLPLVISIKMPGCVTS